ncbi:hypothetical protein OUZ56_012605 [Daphnia magna]|uniref:Uncharacterized protein n=1 Tax=Daphnia magna TaxID=35525 RepID=A0ABQ9Z3I3_9CRUS|nr:hypothetical protein OUZ56_012605 [Daphnia magna]
MHDRQRRFRTTNIIHMVVLESFSTAVIIPNQLWQPHNIDCVVLVDSTWFLMIGKSSLLQSKDKSNLAYFLAFCWLALWQITPWDSQEKGNHAGKTKLKYRTVEHCRWRLDASSKRFCCPL